MHNTLMSNYKPRKIEFKELLKIEDWKVKVYTISDDQGFNNQDFYNNVINKLPNWLNLKNSFNSTNDKIAFLILHKGTEGFFSLINWWVGKNMLNTNIFITDPIKQSNFKLISGDGLAPCVWELEIINHERISWTNNILKSASSPNYQKYLDDTVSCEI